MNARRRRTGLFPRYDWSMTERYARLTGGNRMTATREARSDHRGPAKGWGILGKARHAGLPGAIFIAAALLASGCATAPPKRQGDLCGIFDQRPEWYDYAQDSAEKWGTPIHILMAFVRHESSFRSHAKPPMRWFLFIPLGRPSSAKGYAQAQDPVWGEYQAERGRLFRSRSDMEDALDFIGWYNYKTWRQLDISRLDAYRLYLAYHEGRGGYRRGTWKKKPAVQRTAEKVARTAREYKAQLPGCGSRLRCDAWYQVWPLCN